MKQRHWVTIAVLLVVGAAVYGILDRLRSEPDSRTPGWSSPTGISIDSTTEVALEQGLTDHPNTCLLYTSPSPRDRTRSRMPSSA